jgi:hypothetical protein
MSFWADINPAIQFEDTRKKFFNKYLYKIVIYAPATRLILSKSQESSVELLAERKRLMEYRTYINRYWFPRGGQNIADAEAQQIEYFRSVAEQYKDRIKMRVEEPNLTVYSQDEKTLFEIAENDPVRRIIEFHRPVNVDAEAALNRGEVLIKNPTEYEYKVTFKEGFTTGKDTSTQIYEYLYNLGDDVKMTKSCIKNLTARNYWYTSTYFYCKDPSITTFLNLIAPGSISGIYKLTRLEE